MDKVLKRRLIGASIIIALAVIFVPMLLVDPDSVGGSGDDGIDVPPMPESAREVRRIPLDPEAARVRPSEETSPLITNGRGPSRASGPGDSAAEADRFSPDEEIVLRPDLAVTGEDRIEAGPESAGPAPGTYDRPERRESAEVPESDESDAPESQAEPAQPPAQPSEPSQAATGGWVVQVASFGSEDAANQVRARLEALGHAVARDEIVRGQSVLHRLRTGPYPNRAAAEQALAQISATVAGVEPIVREIDEEMQQATPPGFAVQVGSFVSQDNADSEAARLDGLGFESFHFSEQIGERLIWRVMVGPVSSRSDADALKSRVIDQAGVEGLVVSYP